MAHVSQVQYYNEAVEKQMGFVASVQTGKPESGPEPKTSTQR